MPNDWWWLILWKCNLGLSPAIPGYLGQAKLNVNLSWIDISHESWHSQGPFFYPIHPTMDISDIFWRPEISVAFLGYHNHDNHDPHWNITIIFHSISPWYSPMIFTHDRFYHRGSSKSNLEMLWPGLQKIINKKSPSRFPSGLQFTSKIISKSRYSMVFH